ncbi:arabinofuranosidase catalytic domain-containing protein [Klebsiella oxytoca]|uniref:arabinofuranosidase catalytic domain-containing protein n=1 Tax=Klebsiella oxytoca TaxID=571 RepID=UPI000BFD894C|nr:arabinofuranosidase catalytic domain-containing protein [Klebsiella oxytoca]PHH15680.1 hypothetical protein CRX54_20150 [Klebsiella oxytoca]HED3230834.1 hypothetical protein [Klebsiella oxytoca]HED3472005.1 hypothetical protein [Klebsiella oxytoca]
MLVLNSNSAYTGDKKDLPGYWPTFGYTPTVALSLRQLSASYTGPAIRVRRSSDNTEINIGFTAEGDLDTTALLNFCGSGNGFISVWYDQSGNEFNAIRDNVSGQPRIVSEGVIDLIGSKPGVYFDGTSDALSMTAAVSAVSGVKGVSSSIVLRFRAMPSAACSVFSFYKSGESILRRYGLGSGFQVSSKSYLQVISNQADSGNAGIVTETTPFTVNTNIIARTYVDLNKNLQGIAVDNSEWITGSAPGDVTGVSDSAVLGGGPWVSGIPRELCYVTIGEFILVDSKSDYFLRNIAANQQKYFTD